MKTTSGVPFPPPLAPLAMIVAGALLQRFNPAWWPAGIPWRVAGGVIALSGLSLVAASIITMRRLKTHPSPFKETTALAARGPYRFTRNPIYLGFLLVQAGVALAFALPATLALVPLSWLLLDRLIVRKEEAYLRGKFGEAYADYRARVRRWL